MQQPGYFATALNVSRVLHPFSDRLGAIYFHMHWHAVTYIKKNIWSKHGNENDCSNEDVKLQRTLAWVCEYPPG